MRPFFYQPFHFTFQINKKSTNSFHCIIQQNINDWERLVSIKYFCNKIPREQDENNLFQMQNSPNKLHSEEVIILWRANALSVYIVIFIYIFFIIMKPQLVVIKHTLDLPACHGLEVIITSNYSDEIQE